MRRNNHRWKESVSPELLRVLDEAIGDLDWAWKTDRKYPKSYPFNTDHMFGQVQSRVMSVKSGRHPPQRTIKGLPPPPPPPISLSELVDERTIKAVYENQNDGGYGEALRLAATGDERAWKRILFALKSAYLIDRFGYELVPRPKVHFLHRKLLQLAKLADLADLTDQGTVEFLDDICPCGRKHAEDAVRKIRKRWKRSLHSN